MHQEPASSLPEVGGFAPEPLAEGPREAVLVEFPRELTARALLSGALIGVLMAISNVYLGLKLGIWESGSVVASLLAFSVMRALTVRRSGAVSPLETNLAQTVATSVGSIPATAGLMGAIPALALMGAPPTQGAVVLWGVALGTLGILMAAMLRRRLLEEEALPFPTGIATAEVISSLHAGGENPPTRTRGLWGAGLFSILVVWLRDARQVIPAASFLPGRLSGVSAAQLQLGVGWSPMMLGIGMLVGPQMGLSLLLGALVAWGGLSPWLMREGWVASAEYAPLVSWLTWPGVGLMVGASATTLAALGRSLPRAAADLLRLGRSDAARRGAVDPWMGGAVLLTILLTLGVGYTAFAMHPLHLLLVLAFFFPLCAVGARAAGQTDISPVNTLGDLQQAIIGTVAPGHPALSVSAGSVVAGAMASTSVSLWSLQSGRLLGASPLRQLWVQLTGMLLGVAVSVPTYVLLVESHGLGSPELPSPAALQFRAVAEVSAQGLDGLPPAAMLAAGLGTVVGILLSLAARSRWARFIPSATAMGIGFLVPAHFSVTICLGALLTVGIQRVWPASTRMMHGLGAGAIVGEALLGVLLALLSILGG